MPTPAVLFDIDGTLVDTNYFHADLPASTLGALLGSRR